SPIQNNDREKAFQRAYLQSVFVEQSDTSRYRLMALHRDGSNRHLLFPQVDTHGIPPQAPTRAHAALRGQTGNYIAIVYQGNLWLIDSGSGNSYQVTGDGLITEIDWK